MSAIILEELFQSLLSKKGDEKMTSQETNIFLGWKSEALKSFAVGGSVATGLTWMVTRRLKNFNCVTVAGGVGFFTGIVRLTKSIDSCVDRILGMDGSRMQQELKKIILEKYGNDPKKMQPFSKHFYCEEIFNDSTTGHPQSYYRQRHLYVEDQRTADGNAHHEAVKKGVNYQQRTDDSNVKLKSPTAEIKQVPINASISIFGYADPLDVLFGYSSEKEVLHPSDESGNLAKVQNHRQKRARRKHRLRHRHQESEPLSMGAAQYQGAWGVKL